MRVVPLQVAATTVVAGASANLGDLRAGEKEQFDTSELIIKTSAGTSVSIQPEVSVDGTVWVPLGSAFTTVNSGTAIAVPRVPYVRANITAVSGVTVSAWLVV